jgi:RNA polymerase sigma factor (sigma-70 family)
MELPESDRQRAWHALVHRYEHLIHAVCRRNRLQDDADDIVQETFVRLWLNLSRVDFRPGSARRLIVTTITNCIREWGRARRRHLSILAGAEAAALVGPVAKAGISADDEAAGVELVQRAMERLRRQDEQTGKALHAVLLMRLNHSDESMGELARRLSRPGKERTSSGVASSLFLARRRLAELLREEVAATLHNPTPEEVDEELAELGLLVYCRHAR